MTLSHLAVAISHSRRIRASHAGSVDVGTGSQSDRPGPGPVGVIQRAEAGIDRAQSDATEFAELVWRRRRGK